MGNERYRRTLAMNGLGEPDGAVLLRLFDKRSNVGYPIANLDGMFDGKLLRETLRRLEHDELVIVNGGRIFLSCTGRSITADLAKTKGYQSITRTASAEAATARKTDENLRSVFG